MKIAAIETPASGLMRYSPDTVGVVWRTACRNSGTLKSTALLQSEKRNVDHIKYEVGGVVRSGKGRTGLVARLDIGGRAQHPRKVMSKAVMGSGCRQGRRAPPTLIPRIRQATVTVKTVAPAESKSLKASVSVLPSLY